MDICTQDLFSREKSFSTIIQYLALREHHLPQPYINMVPFVIIVTVVVHDQLVNISHSSVFI